MKIKLTSPSYEHIEEITKARDTFIDNNEAENGISGSSYLMDYKTIEDWIEFVKIGKGKSGQVPFRQYVALNEQNEVVGFINIRITLNEYLLNYGGHIGYGVTPHFRKKSIATEMLKQALLICKKEGMHEVLVTCLNSNIGSEKVILNNNGIFEDARTVEDKTFKRFWITI